LAFAQSAVEPACRKSFAADAPRLQTSRLPKRGVSICVAASPAALQVPIERGARRRAPSRRRDGPELGEEAADDRRVGLVGGVLK
jgi:hypothetical protein